MGTRGLRVVRFRKRYYIFYNQYDSYPSGLGKEVAAEIPTDAAKYQDWLAAQRKAAEEWEALYEDFLSVRPGNEVISNLPDFMREHFPSLLTPLNDTWIEWVYTVDLDRETFSVNNGAHFKLDQIPHVDWISSLTRVAHGDQISLPGSVPEEAVTDLVVQYNFESGDLSKALSSSEATAPIQETVIPKDIKDIPWRQRHGPILRNLTFHLWASANEDLLAAQLLQMSPEDLPFREFAYSALCLAAGGKNINIISSENVTSNGVLGFIHEEKEYNADSEFIGVIASGAHLQGSPPGSSPQDTLYWLENVLVVLTAHLYRPGAADEGIARITNYCQQNQLQEPVDAVLISIEQVVLVHVTPSGEVQHTAVMPLLNIKNHLAMSASDRYAKPYLEKLAVKDEEFTKEEAKKQKKVDQERMLKNDGIVISHGDDNDEDDNDNELDSDEEEEDGLRATQVDGNLCSTFYALVHLFEAAACKRMPPPKAADGRVPNEIYTQIIKHVTDMETRQSLMKVSRTFRRLCQEDLLFAEGLIFESSEACQGCEEAEDVAEWYKKFDVATGTRSRVNWKGAGGFLDYGGTSWKVAVGAERNKKSLLAGVAFRFREV